MTFDYEWYHFANYIFEEVYYNNPKLKEYNPFPAIIQKFEQQKQSEIAEKRIEFQKLKSKAFQLQASLKNVIEYERLIPIMEVLDYYKNHQQFHHRAYNLEKWEAYYNTQNSSEHSQIISAAESVALTIKENLIQRQAKRTVIDRLVAFAENYKKKELSDKLENAGRNKESICHDFVNEYLFLQGYYPFIEPEQGDGRLDTIALANKATFETVFILEVKQWFNEISSEKEAKDKLREHIRQTNQYLTNFQKSAPNIAGSDAYLLIFYGENMIQQKEKRFELAQNYVKTNDGLGTIFIELIYIGKLTPSEKSESIRLNAEESRNRNL